MYTSRTSPYLQLVSFVVVPDTSTAPLHDLLDLLGTHSRGDVSHKQRARGTIITRTATAIAVSSRIETVAISSIVIAVAISSVVVAVAISSVVVAITAIVVSAVAVSAITVSVAIVPIVATHAEEVARGRRRCDDSQEDLSPVWPWLCALGSRSHFEFELLLSAVVCCCCALLLREDGWCWFPVRSPQQHSSTAK